MPSKTGGQHRDLEKGHFTQRVYRKEKWERSCRTCPDILICNVGSGTGNWVLTGRTQTFKIRFKVEDEVLHNFPFYPGSELSSCGP